MSAPFIIPFNNQPVATVPKSGAGYTVPAGKYARVSGAISVTVMPSQAAAATVSNGAMGANSGNQVLSFSFWLKAGDVITLNQVEATNSGTISVGTAVTVSGVSTASILVNSVDVARVHATGSISYSGNIASSYAFTGTTTVNYLCEEYYIIS